MLCSSNPKTFADADMKACPFSISNTYRQYTTSHNLQLKTKFRKHPRETAGNTTYTLGQMCHIKQNIFLKILLFPR